MVRVNNLQLTSAEALALSQLSKRFFWELAKQLAVCDAEAYDMLNALSAVHKALAAQGIETR